jgi:hypothetical protein
MEVPTLLDQLAMQCLGGLGNSHLSRLGSRERACQKKDKEEFVHDDL